MIKDVDIRLAALMVWLVAFVVSYLAVPRILTVLLRIKLLEKINNRSSHRIETPSMGGAAFYLSFISALFLIGLCYNTSFSLAVVFGATVMFFMGVKDDIAIIRPQSKVLAQVLITLALLPFVEFRLTNFEGFLFLQNIPLGATVLISCLITFIIINAYNLIDGIDGLAGMLGIVIFGIFAYFYYRLQDNFFFLLSISGTGFLLAFLRFNLSKHRKIFMGDTGSMVVGFLIAILSLHFLTLNAEKLTTLAISLPQYKFLILFAILFVPVADFIRVFLMRLLKSKNPFLPDRQHVHHLLTDKIGLPHWIASLLLAVLNFVVFFVSIFFCF